jgi:diadenosine tetraphosphate (Ap4A) HIT family hydrolase
MPETPQQLHARAAGHLRMPVVLVLEPRVHVDNPATMDDELLREMGVMLGRVERAVLSVGNIGRVHIGRWGEGAEHLHWWFIARPAGFTQMATSFAEVWNDVLPPTPEEVYQDNLARVAAAMDATSPS